MGFLSWLTGKMAPGAIKVSGDGWDADPEIFELYAEACYRDMAMWTAIDLISKSISKCEFKFFANGEVDKGPEWYRWNVEPNKNQNSSAFLRQLVSTLYLRGECLVIEQAGQLLVADSFTRKRYALYDDIFEGVAVGDFTFNRSFSGAEVLYWNLNSLGDTGPNVQGIIRAVCSSYAKLLAYSMKSYQRSRGSKAIFRYDTISPNVLGEESLGEWVKRQIQRAKTFLDADSAVYPMGKGVGLEGFDRKSTYSNESTRDIRHMIDDISDFTAKSLGVHPALLRGDVQDIDSATDYTLTFCIDPLVDMLREEIVRKSIGQAGLAAGYDMLIDTSQVKHIDVMSASGSIDKLIGSGVFCVNDILTMLGRPVIDEDWAREHYITRNYMPFDEALQAAKGGENE